MSDFPDGLVFGPVTRDQERADVRALVGCLPVRDLLVRSLGDVFYERDRRSLLSARWSAVSVPVPVVPGVAELRRRAAVVPRPRAAVVATVSAPTRGPDGSVWASPRTGCSGMR